MRAVFAVNSLTLSLGASVAALVAVTGAATAGGFAVREQSAQFLGSAFAGAAAGGGLSSMFWNSAAASFAPSGLYSESNYSLILPDSEITAEAPSTFLVLGASSGDIGDTAVVPASYMSYRLSENMVAALGINAPFGLVTDPSNRTWAGAPFARESKIETYNFNPTVAYQVSPGISVGVGLQIEYIKAGLRSASSTGLDGDLAIKGDDIGFGFTAGILLNPMAGTAIGLGYRSRIEHTLEGTIHRTNSGSPSEITADVTLPDIVTLSLRQAVAPAWTLLGTVEWTNWSEVPRLDIVCDVPGGTFCGAAGQPVTSLALGWHDSWFFSAGLEHEYSSQLTLRGGIAYEISPIEDPDERTPRVPDADRIWLSAGATYRYSDTMTIDLAYSHIFVEDSRLDRIEGGARLVGEVESSVDIISVGVKSKLDWLLSGG